MKSQVVQVRAGFHHTVMDVRTPQAEGVSNNAAAFHTANYMFDLHALRSFFFRGQRTPARLFLGLLDQHPRAGKALKTRVLI